MTCTFNNTQAGTIVVEKETDPPRSTELFAFTTDYSADFHLADGESNDLRDPLPPAHLLGCREPCPPAGTSPPPPATTAANPSPSASTPVRPSPARSSTRPDANIIVDKQTDPGGSTQAFTFTTDYGADFHLADGDSNDSA